MLPMKPVAQNPALSITVHNSSPQKSRTPQYRMRASRRGDTAVRAEGLVNLINHLLTILSLFRPFQSSQVPYHPPRFQKVGTLWGHLPLVARPELFFRCHLNVSLSMTPNGGASRNRLRPANLVKDLPRLPFKRFHDNPCGRESRFIATNMSGWEYADSCI